SPLMSSHNITLFQSTSLNPTMQSAAYFGVANVATIASFSSCVRGVVLLLRGNCFLLIVNGCTSPAHPGCRPSANVESTSRSTRSPHRSKFLLSLASPTARCLRQSLASTARRCTAVHRSRLATGQEERADLQMARQCSVHRDHDMLHSN